MLKQKEIKVKFKELMRVFHIAQKPLMDKIMDELNNETSLDLIKFI